MCTSTLPPTAYCDGAIAPITTSEIPVRSICFSFAQPPDLAGIVIGTGNCGTCIFVTPSPSVARREDDRRRAQHERLVRRRAGQSVRALIGVRRAQHDRALRRTVAGRCRRRVLALRRQRRPADFLPRLSTYAASCVACASVSCGCGGIITSPHTPEPPALIFFDELRHRVHVAAILVGDRRVRRSDRLAIDLMAGEAVARRRAASSHPRADPARRERCPAAGARRGGHAVLEVLRRHDDAIGRDATVLERAVLAIGHARRVLDRRAGEEERLVAAGDVDVHLAAARCRRRSARSPSSARPSRR